MAAINQSPTNGFKPLQKSPTRSDDNQSPPMTPTHSRSYQSYQSVRTSKNGFFHSNGFSTSGMQSHHRRRSSIASAISRGGRQEEYRLVLVQDTANVLRNRSATELGSSISKEVVNTTFVSFIEWITSERLTRLPQKGSTWDKVLIRAQYFAEQLHTFDHAIQGFAIDSTAAAQIGYGHAKLLLELGSENSDALDKVFGFFYKCSLSISSLLERADLLGITAQTREALSMMYADLLTLVTDVAVRFYKTVHGMMGSHAHLDIFEVFGETIQTFRSRKVEITQEIWNYQIENSGVEAEDALDVDVLSRWLTPQDPVLSSLSNDHTLFAEQQAEFTCLWFLKHLSHFMQCQDKFMLINGDSTSGKTVLAASIVERLQRPIGRKSYSTIFCSINAEIPSQATSLALVKSLLHQLLEIRIGNLSLYNALAEAYQHSKQCSTTEAYEQHLWDALTVALKHPYDNANDLVVIVDGLDELEGGVTTKQSVIEQLSRVVDNGQNVKFIALSKDLKMSSSKGGHHINISADDNRDDIRTVISQKLRENHIFQKKQFSEQEDVIGRILRIANGSFLLAIFAVDILSFAKADDSFFNGLKALESGTPSLNDFTQKLLSAADPNSNTKMLISWLLSAARPLTFAELSILFSINLKGNTISDNHVDVVKLTKPLKSILTFHENVVRIRHHTVHTALKSIVDHGKFNMPVKDGQLDFLLRTLVYAKQTITDTRDPSLHSVDTLFVASLFRKYGLLEYAIRYWPYHLTHSSISKPSGEFALPSDFHKVLPNNALLPLLEKTCWDTEYPTSKLIDLHHLVGRLRRQTLPENSVAVLQSYITIALYYQTINNSTEASKYWYDATQICCKVLNNVHKVTMECTNRFLSITETVVVTERTEVVTRREQLLQVLIKAYEYHYGATAEITIQTQQTLAELYVSIKEEHRATEIFTRIRDLTVRHYGRYSDEARGLNEHLNVLLNKGKGQTQVNGHSGTIFGDTQKEDDTEIILISEISQIEVWIRRADMFITKKDYFAAEQIYIELWQQVSSRCRTTRNVEWHEKSVDIAIIYSKFLKTQKREFESTSVMTCVWQEYEHHELSFTESIVYRLTQIAQQLKSVGYHSVALSIFKHARSYYSSVRKEEHKEFREIQHEIEVTSEEVIQQTITSSSSEESSVSESTFRSVFHSLICNHSKTIDKSTMVMAKKLTATYIEEQNYSEAISVVKETLKRTWASFFSESVQTVSITSTFTEESFELVQCLAQCYFYQRHFEKVEDAYVRLFHAVLTSKQPESLLFQKVVTLLIDFYDKYGYVDKAIGVYQEILVVYKKVLGQSHKRTVETLYTLGSRCRKHARNHPYWIEYYQQILIVLNKDASVCHHDAMQAIVIVGTYYWEDRRYAEASTVYAILWNTFIHKTKEYADFQKTDFVKLTYGRYFQCLEETRVELDVLHKVTSEYREVCTRTYGASAEITVEATISLAQVSQRSEKYMAQAISLYEEVSRSSHYSKKTEVTRTLTKLYKKQIKSKLSSTMHSETVERALHIYSEQFSESKKRYGYSSMTTLSSMREMVLLYSRQQKTDLVVKQLTTAISEIVTKETSSEKLIESSAHIAETFQLCHQEKVCHEIIEELRSQIIARDFRSTSRISIQETSSNRSSLVFLAGLEYRFRKDIRLTFTEIMADLSITAFYFDNYRTCKHRSSALEQMLLGVAPLRHFLLKKNHSRILSFLEDDVAAWFTKQNLVKIQLHQGSSRSFIIGVLEQIGQRRNANVVRSIIVGSNARVASLTKQKRFEEAYEVAQIAFNIALHFDGYGGANAISEGFKLALLLAGYGTEKAPQDGVRKMLLQLSNRVAKEMLDICKKNNVNFAQVQLGELNQLAALLGEQQDYETLEWLLSALWTTRDAQRSWPPHVLLSLGRRFICARFLAGQHVQALRLCEDIAYNMRRVHGLRHPDTLDTYRLLSELYTSVALDYQKKVASDKTSSASGLAQEYFKKALLVHEDLLHLLVYEGAHDEDDDELESTAAILSQHGISYKEQQNGTQSVTSTSSTSSNSRPFDKGAFVKDSMHRMKFAYQRLGSWPKPYAEYEKLNAEVFRKFSNEMRGEEGVEKWEPKGFGAGKAESAEGTFAGCHEWEFIDAKSLPAVV